MPVTTESRSPGTPASRRRTVLVAVLAVIAVVALAAVVGGAVWSGRPGNGSQAAADNGAYPDVPALGSPAPARCPEFWDLDAQAGTATRRGRLVPAGAINAVLCSYWTGADSHAWPLSAIRSTTDTGDLIAYLNGLPTTHPDDEECLMMGVTEHAIVFGYSDRPPATVTLRCPGMQQSGAVRFEGNIMKILGFWDVTNRND